MSMPVVESRGIQMSTVPDVRDTDATWNYLRVGIERILQSPKDLGAIDMQTFMRLYQCIHNYCSSRVDPRAHYRGEELYQRLARYLASYLEDRVKSRFDTEETVLAFYIREWDRYRAAAKLNNHIFRYLNRHWVKRERNEGKKNVFDVYTLHLVQWREVAFAKLHTDVMEAVLKMVERQRNGETIELGQIKSIADSFIALGLDKADPTKTTLDIYRHYFEIPFLEATKKFYQNESKQFVVDNGVVEYMKKAEARLGEEDERVKMYLDPNIAEPLRSTCNTALIADHETLLRGEIQSLLDNDKVDDMVRMYNLLSRISGGLDSLPTKFKKHILKAGQQAGFAETDGNAEEETQIAVPSLYSEIDDSSFPAGVQKIARVTGQSDSGPGDMTMKRLPQNRCDIVMQSSKIGWQGMKADLDTGSDESWISKEIVESLSLPIKTGEIFTLNTLLGSTIESSETVSAIWRAQGQTKTVRAEFRVVTIGTAPFDVLFGKNLITSNMTNFCEEKMPFGVLEGSEETHAERQEAMPREIEENESSVVSTWINKSTTSGLSHPADHAPSLDSGYVSIDSKTDNKADHNELTSRDKQLLEDVEEEGEEEEEKGGEEEDVISQKSVERFSDWVSSNGESLVDRDIQDIAQGLILEVFEEDEVLNPLVRESLTKFQRHRVVNNLAGFINGYCVLLSGSQPTLNQARTIRYFRHRSRRFAGLVCENLDPSRLELQEKASRERSQAETAERITRLALFISGSSIDASPPRSEASDDENENDHESWSDSEGLPPVLEDIKIFLTSGEALKLFRQHFASFVAGESIKEWNSMIESRRRLQKGTDYTKALPSFDLLSPKWTDSIIELDSGQGFQVSWRCRCGRRFKARILGSERRAAEEFLQRMDWHVKRDGPMVIHCFNLRWIEDLLWALAPNILGRFSFESSENGAEARDLEAGGVPDPVEPGASPTDLGSQSIGAQKLRRLTSDSTKNEMVYICLSKKISKEWRLMHAKINRKSHVKISEVEKAVDGIDSQNMDKLLFLALREKIVGSWKWIRWINPMVVTQLEFWEFKLYHTAKLVRLVEKDRLPYESECTEPESLDAKAAIALEEWEYTRLTGQKLSEYKEILRSEYLLHLLKFPDDAHPTSPVWTGLPRKIRMKLMNRQPTPKIGWGFTVEYEWNSIAFTVAICPIILIGFVIATYLSIKYKWPISTGITLAMGVVTLVTFVNTMLGGITKQKGLSK